MWAFLPENVIFLEQVIYVFFVCLFYFTIPRFSDVDSYSVFSFYNQLDQVAFLFKITHVLRYTCAKITHHGFGFGSALSFKTAGLSLFTNYIIISFALLS